MECVCREDLWAGDCPTNCLIRWSCEGVEPSPHAPAINPVQSE